MKVNFSLSLIFVFFSWKYLLFHFFFLPHTSYESSSFIPYVFLWRLQDWLCERGRKEKRAVVIDKEMAAGQ